MCTSYNEYKYHSISKGWKHIMVIKDCWNKSYFFETSFVWTSTKSFILKEFFANFIWNKVVQNPRSKIVNKKTCFEIYIKLLKIIFMQNCNCTDILQSKNILQTQSKQSPNSLKYSIIY
jgi:hypothetical protein